MTSTQSTVVLIAMLAASALCLVLLSEAWHYHDHGSILPATVQSLVTKNVPGGSGASRSWNNVDFPVITYTLSDGTSHTCNAFIARRTPR